MGALLWSKTPIVQPSTPPAAALRVQTAVEGKARALIYGLVRIAGNIIWYNNFRARTVPTGQSGGGGGKGGIFGGNNQSQPAAQTTYAAAVELALGEGPVSAIGPRIWASKAVTTLSHYSMSGLLGDDLQDAWSFVVANYPNEALTYRLTPLVVGNLSLGTNPEIPNFTFEVKGEVADATATVSDANPKDVITDFLSNENHGVPGWSTGYNGDWTDLSNYALASGLLLSFALTETTTGNQWLSDVIESINCVPTMSQGKLKIVPRGDKAISGNGASYDPPAAPIYSLTDSDFLPNQGNSFGGTSDDPVAGQRTAPRNQNNVVVVEYLSRDQDYNPATYEAADDSSVRQFGRRNNKGTRNWHWFADKDAAVMAGQLALGREKIANKYAFTLPPRYIALDPGDIVAITDEPMNLDAQWVRILDIKENQDRSLSFLAEEYLLGTGAAPLYGAQAPAGSRPNYNEDPGAMNPPVIFEPTAELIGNAGLQIWIAISGQDLDTYGGCEVWVSYDGENYALADRQTGSARMGVLTADLPTFTVNNTGPTIDDVNTLSVDLSQSQGELISGSQTDALSLNTSCYVDGEIISYQDATLTGTNRYDLTYLVRGVYGTESLIANHPAGTEFVRLDQGILHVPFDQTRIGSTIQIKLVPFNVWGQGGMSLADVEPITYTIQGTAMRTPLPTLQNLTSKFVDGRLNITWDEVEDFRTGIRYEIRKGDTFDGALSLGTVAHPPFPVPGDGVYWVTGWVQPVPGLIVLSEDPTSILVAGATINSNVLATFDCKAEGWPGTFVNTGIDSGLNAIRLGGAGDILGVSDVLAMDDVLNFGGIVASGSYSPSFSIDIGRVAPVQITITFVGTGAPTGANILDDLNILDTPDILGSASAAFVDVFPKVLISQTGGAPFAPGIKYSPGIYVGRTFEFEFDLSSIDPKSIAYLLSAEITVDVPDRIDSRGIISAVVTSLTNLTVPAAGVDITFVPDGASAAAPFNGGPGGAPGSLPQIVATWGDEQPGDVLEVSAETVAGCTVRILNGGVGVQRDKVNIFIRGY